MKRMPVLRSLGPGVAIALLMLVGAAETPPVGGTLDNLCTAYAGESAAYARYTAAARVAAEEGYTPLAALFRAAARAEQIHATNFIVAIMQLGGTPHTDVPMPVIETTAENLAQAVTGENYERDELYPAFAQKAHQEKQPAAERVFILATAAETDHARLYSDAAATLADWRDGIRVFYVCPTCGKIVTSLDVPTCPACGMAATKFEIFP